MKELDKLKTLGTYISAAASVSTRVSWQDKRDENQKKRKKKSDLEGIEAKRQEILEKELEREDDGHIDFMA